MPHATTAQVSYAALLLPDFALIALGWLLCRFTALNRSVWQSVDALVYCFLFPVLLVQSILRWPLDVRTAGGLMGAGLALAAVGIALAWSLPALPWLGRQMARRDHAACAQVAFRFNSFIALALADRLAGAQAVQWMAVLIGLCVPVFNAAAVLPMARHAGRRLGAEMLRNPLIVATLLGLCGNLCGLALPDALAPTATRLSTAAVALGLMATGAGMQLHALASAKALGTAVLLIRHVLLPVAAWALARAFALDGTQALALLVFAAVPTASSCYVLAARMGYNGAQVAALVTLSTALGMLSLPLALGVLAAAA